MEFLKNLGIGKLLGISIAGIILFALILVFANRLSSTPMAVLYTNVTLEDSSLITARLEAMGIMHETNAGGNEILVPVDRVLMLRMRFAQDGIPTSGSVIGYEIFDKSDTLGTSQFIHNINLLRALEGELSRTIGTLTPIQSARVHLVIPKKELFSKIGNEPSASVVLRIKESNNLSKKEIEGISHLVATAVPALKTET